MRTTAADRAITIVALIQVGVIVGGTLFVSAMMRVFGYGSAPAAFFTPKALFVRNAGFLVLLFPVVWTLLAISVARMRSGSLWSQLILLLGVVAIPFGIYWYLRIGFCPTFSTTNGTIQLGL